MPEQLPPNMETAYRSELAGLEARLYALDETGGDHPARPNLEDRVASLRGLLGEVNGVPKRRGRPPKTTRPADEPGMETAAAEPVVSPVDGPVETSE